MKLIIGFWALMLAASASCDELEINYPDSPGEKTVFNAPNESDYELKLRSSSWKCVLKKRENVTKDFSSRDLKCSKAENVVVTLFFCDYRYPNVPGFLALIEKGKSTTIGLKCK